MELHHPYLFLLLAAMLAAACTSDPVLQGPEAVVGGESTLQATVGFRPLEISPGGSTRAAGGALKYIDDLNVIIYRLEEGTWKFDRCVYYDTFQSREEVERSGGSHAEAYTPRVTFSLVLPNGHYRMYAAANLGDLNSIHPETIRTEEGLRSIPLRWKQEDMAANAQMFGFFSRQEEIPAPDTHSEEITVNGNCSLYAWIRRAASKVTLAYDGSGLNENIFIYIDSVQIRDIPATCPLGNRNTPTGTGELIAAGGTLVYARDEAYDNRHPIRITRGMPHHPSDRQQWHTEGEEALYFYENLQGTGEDKRQDTDLDGIPDHPGQPGDPTYRLKDGKTFGTYVEVKGYYVNQNRDRPSSGTITYRFMLGKDIMTDYNAERNHHYKLTLKFRKDANNPDWHIEYVPETPEIRIPDPVYISYLNLEKVDVPVVVTGVPDGTPVRAEIISNPWWTVGHKYNYVQRYDHNGFLLLTRGADSPADRMAEFSNGSTATYTVQDGICNASLWTRGLTLGSSFSGSNIDFMNTRIAQVRFSVTMDGRTFRKDIDVIQVRRLENPAGIWRKHNSTKAFRVTVQAALPASGPLMQEYEPVISEGPWSALIIHGQDWIQISRDGQTGWGNAPVKGSTGSTISFSFRPGSVIGADGYRSGVIKVRYHNNSAVHYIMASQGTGKAEMAGTRWHTCNFYSETAGDVANPLMEGCMFIYGNPVGLTAANNTLEDFGRDNTHTLFHCNDGTRRRMLDIHQDREGFGTNVSTKAQWDALHANSINRYGILYGEESETCSTTMDGASGYREEGDRKGMRGLFCIDQNGQSLFFPIGCTGYGHRKYIDRQNREDQDGSQQYCVLRYAQRMQEMPVATAERVPNYYDLYLRKGAIYWYREPEGNNYAHDINYYTYLVGSYGKNAVTDGQHSDACFIRRTAE